MGHTQWFMTLPLKNLDADSPWKSSLHSGAVMQEERRNIRSNYLLEKKHACYVSLK